MMETWMDFSRARDQTEIRESGPRCPPSSLSSSLSCPAGLNDWDDDEILASVLAVSQQEYLDSMKKNKVHRDPPPDKS